MDISKWTKAAALCGIVLAAYTLTSNVVANEPTSKKSSAQPPSVQATSKLESGINLKDMDLNGDPRRDFYEYAIGGWKKANPIPADQARWGTFTIMADQNTELLHKVLEKASTSPQTDLELKLGRFYKSGMDTQAIERSGISSIKGDLEVIDSIDSPLTLQQSIASLHRQNLSPYFALDGAQDDKDSSRVIATIWQAGLGLPERDYYLRHDVKSKKLRDQYVRLMIDLFKLSGYTDTKAKWAAQRVMKLETRLAQASVPAAEMRDPEKMYNLWTQEQLGQGVRAIDWKVYYRAIGLEMPKEVNVTVPQFMLTVNDLLADESLLQSHKDYLAWNVIRGAAPYLGEEFEKAHFAFYNQALRGVEAMKPRWKRVTDVVGTYMDQGLGQLYVKEAFPPESKAHVERMVENIKGYMAETIPTLVWMSETTKTEALKKLNAFRAKIGYPEVPRDYSALHIGDTYYENVRNCRIFEKRRTLDKIGRPVDPNEWHMPPQMVNAYYSPSENEIVFPAGILQPPFFDPKVDDAANYGGIGMVIGHEISHGFDDQGAQYDGKGNLRNWWTKEDLAKFQKLTKGVEDQFSAYTVQGQHLNGKLVLGESIADLSGIALSWGAYQRQLNGQPGPIIDNFTPAQRFFLNYAKIWAINMSPEMELLQINTDPHPPAQWRVNGPLSNFEVFFEAFNVKEGDPMRRPADKINKIW